MDASGREQRADLRTLRAALLATTLSAALGLTTLTKKALWFDETYNVTAVRGPWRELFRRIGESEMSQAAYLIALKVWTELTSVTEVALRIPSVVLTAISSALLVQLGTRMFGRTAGALAGVLFATNAMVVAWSQQARTYALVTLAVLVASRLLVRAIENPRRTNWLQYAIAAAVSVYCHFFAGFVVVAHVASLPFARRRPPLRYVAEAGALFMTLIVPALYFTATASRATVSWITPPTSEELLDVIAKTFGWNGLLAIAAVAGLVRLARASKGANDEQRWQAHLLFGWLAWPFVLALLVSREQPILVSRYAIVVTPAIALTAAVALTALLETRRVLGVCALVLVVAIAGDSVLTWYQRVPEDWRGAAAFIARERKPHDALLIVPPYATEAYRYYDSTAVIAAPTAERRSFFVVRGEPTPYAAIPDAYRAGHRLVDAKRFGREVSVFVYERLK